MLAATRLRLNERRRANERRATGSSRRSRKCPQGVKVLSRLQLPADLLAGVTRSAARRCRTRAGRRHVSRLQRSQDPAHRAAVPRGAWIVSAPATKSSPDRPTVAVSFSTARATPRPPGAIGGNTVAGFAGTGAPKVLTWCPTCNIQLERDRHAEHATRASIFEHVVPYIAARIERLRPHFVHPIKKRVALHEHPGVAGVTEGAIKILTAIPGLELVDLEQPRSATCATRWRRFRPTNANCMPASLTPRQPPASTTLWAFTMPAIVNFAPRNHFAVQDRQLS